MSEDMIAKQAAKITRLYNKNKELNRDSKHWEDRYQAAMTENDKFEKELIDQSLTNEIAIGIQGAVVKSLKEEIEHLNGTLNVAAFDVAETMNKNTLLNNEVAELKKTISDASWGPPPNGDWMAQQ